MRKATRGNRQTLLLFIPSTKMSTVGTSQQFIHRKLTQREKALSRNSSWLPHLPQMLSAGCCKPRFDDPCLVSLEVSTGCCVHPVRWCFAICAVLFLLLLLAMYINKLTHLKLKHGYCRPLSGHTEQQPGMWKILFKKQKQ